MVQAADKYPATLSIDYPDRELNRLSTFFRIFTVIPIFIVLALIVSTTLGWDNPDKVDFRLPGGGLVFLPIVLMLLFQQKYPRWWFDWNIALIKFSTRVLLTSHCCGMSTHQLTKNRRSTSKYPTRMPRKTSISGCHW